MLINRDCLKDTLNLISIPEHYFFHLIAIVLLVSNLSSNTSVDKIEDSFFPNIKGRAGQLDGAVITPNGNSFYTLKGELVTHWRLNPIKRLSSFNTGAIAKDEHHRYTMHITDDAKKLVLNSPTQIQLWDLKDNSLVIKKDVNITSGVMLESDFYTINKDRTLIKRSTKDLHVIKKKTFPNLCNDKKYLERACEDEPYAILGYGKNLVFCSYTFVKLVSLSNMSKIQKKYVKRASTIAVSIDQQYIYWIINGYTDGVVAENRPDLKRLDIKTGETQLASPLYIHRSRKVSHLRDYVNEYSTLSFQRFPKGLSSSVNGISLVQSRFKPAPSFFKKRRFGFFNTKTKEIIGKFFQFEDGEWILLNKNGYFEGSKNAREHLLMRNKARIRYPISDEIYKKFNKKIIIKAN